MSKEGVDLLKANPNFEVDFRKATELAELQKIIGNFECIEIRSATKLTKELIEMGTNLKLIVRGGAGVDNIDVPTATARKIAVMNTATANSLAAAEMTIALMFSMLRQVPQAAQSLKEGKWDREKFKGFEVTGKTLGVIGLGNIGKIVAEKAIGLGMKVLAYDPVIKSMSQVTGKLARMDDALKIEGTVDGVLASAHIVTLHVPKNAETSNLINTDRIAKMRDGAYVINCSRGGIVDEKALIAALDSGKLAGAALDVFPKEPPEFPQPVFTHAKIVATPHLGASTVEAQERVGLTAANQINGFFERGEKTGIINL